jgi:hypothetical protein
MSGTNTTAGTTLLLDTQLWDLVCDASGNIALAAPPYAVAQDAASACRLFLGECWYDTSQGVPYIQQILGKYPPLSLVKAQLVAAALTVPGVITAQVFITSFAGRKLQGQVQVTDTSGATSAAAF